VQDHHGESDVPPVAGETGSIPSSPTPVSPTLLDFMKQRWQGSYLGSKVSGRFVRFALVGGIGVFVNLLAMAQLLRLTGLRDWRASAMASVVAALHNYVLNNGWTFRDRRRTGRAFLSGAFVYLPMAAVGIAVTALVYSLFAGVGLRMGYGSSSWYLLGAQLIAILFGTYLNYSLNDSFTWRRNNHSSLKITVGAPGKSILGKS